MRKLDLDKLLEGLSGIPDIYCQLFYKTAIVALLKSGHQSGVKLNLTGAIEEDFELVWQEKMTEEELQEYVEIKQVCSTGAVGISLLIAKELFGFQRFKEALQGTGIDFWLERKTSKSTIERPFIAEARLEISGIFKENKSNTINMRIGQKRKQMSIENESSLEGWISVVEFQTPKSKFIKK